MNFKKLALAAAVAVAPMSALALEPMQDDALSAVTGQDGINIGITTNNLNLDVYVHDKDGLTGSGLSGDSGAIVIEGMAINTNGGEIGIEIDADGNSGAGVLNVGVSLPNNIEIKTGDLSVADSDRDTGAWGIVAGTQSNTILKNSTITLGATNLNIQLGNEVQGAMIALDTTITNGITITDGGLLDANAVPTTPGEDVGILFDSLAIKNNGGADLTVEASVDVVNDGLVVALTTLGDAGGVDMRIENQRLGAASTNPLGDIEIVGLDLNGTTLRIGGK